MAILDGMRSSLRKAGGILSPTVYENNQKRQMLAEDRQYKSQMINEDRNFQMEKSLFEQAVSAMSQTADPTQRQEIFQSSVRPFLQKYAPETGGMLDQSMFPVEQGDIRNDPNGVPRYVNSGDPVFPGVEKDTKPSFDPEMVKIPGLPDDYKAVRTGPNSVRVLSPRGDSVDYSTEIDEKGNLAILRKDKNGISVEGYVEQNGEKFKTFRSRQQEMINEREEQRQRGANDRASIRQENIIDDDVRNSLKPLNELDLNIKKVKTVLDTDDLSGLDAKALRNTLSQLFNTDVRAQAELNSFSNYGDIAERASGLISGLVRGTPTDSQVNMAKDIIDRFERMVERGKLEIYEQAGKRAQAQSEGRDVDIRPEAFIPESPELSPEEEAELEALRVKQGAK